MTNGIVCGGDGDVSEAEAVALEKLRTAVGVAAGELPDDSPWVGTLAVLDEELREGQPFFLRFALASSSRSMSETPVTSA